MPELLRDYHYEVVVLGGGPAGIAAACVAAESGCRVALLESTPWLGGPLWRTLPDVPAPREARVWLGRLGRSTVEVFDRTTAFAATNPDVLHAERGDEALHIGWNKLILASGAQELFLPFPGWTLPNVFGVGGLQLLAKTGWPADGRRVVVAGSGPLAFAAAAYLARSGAIVTDIVDQASWRDLVHFALGLPWLAPSKLMQAAGFKWQLMRTRFRAGCWVTAAEGRTQLERVTITDGKRTWQRECDYLACAYGLVSNLQWPRYLGCAVEQDSSGQDSIVVDPYQCTSVANVYCAGEVAGIAGIDAALVAGQIAGYAAASQNKAAERLFPARARGQRFAESLAHAFRLRPELLSLATDSTIVCRCEDVTWGEIQACNDLRSAKLHSRCGMGTCQGRVCHTALRQLKGWSAEVPRPPLHPVRVGALAGASNALEAARR
jgi:NADPH-dependent 2,4-dienoyl-CoA reductase/sulfur reductase-like enzyme